MKSVLDPDFEYTPSAKTDLKKTFARIRREQKAEQAEQDRLAADTLAKVSKLHTGVKP